MERLPFYFENRGYFAKFFDRGQSLDFIERKVLHKHFDRNNSYQFYREMSGISGNEWDIDE
jgi:hypothetical protein